MGRALQDAALGIRPGSGAAIVPPMPGELPDGEADATIVARRPSDATVVSSRARATPAPATVKAREPRPGPERRASGAQPTRRPPSPDRPIGERERTRLIVLAAGLVVVAILAAVLIISLNGGSSHNLTLEQNWSSHATTAVQQLQQVVNNNQQ
jgi:hypothetical protein